jgi:hypothetical protein
MAERMLAKPGAGAVPVTIGDMTRTRVQGTFQMVYLVANTIMNVTTHDEQLAVFANAAAHLRPCGCFVVEVEVPQLRRVPPGETGWIFTLDPGHLGIETFDDTAAQIAWSPPPATTRSRSSRNCRSRPHSQKHRNLREAGMKECQVVVLIAAPGWSMIRSASRPDLPVLGVTTTRVWSSMLAMTRRPKWARPRRTAYTVTGRIRQR